MVQLAPVKTRRTTGGVAGDRGDGRFVEQRGDPGARPVVQPELKNPFAAGLADALKTPEGPVDFRPEAWEPELAEPWEGKRLYRVFIPGHPISTIRADDQDSAVGRYNALNGVIGTDVRHTVEDVTEGDPGDEDDGKEAAKQPAGKRPKKDTRPLAEQLDD